jgi:hypothetical protein
VVEGEVVTQAENSPAENNFTLFGALGDRSCVINS